VAFCFPLDKLAQDSYDVAVYNLAFFLLPQWCFILPLCGGAKKHEEMWIQFKCFLVGRVFFIGPNFGGKSKFNAFSST
jgi:hypothetical protein